MSDPQDVSVDEAWLAEWAADGIAAAERLLASHAAFDAYLRGVRDPHEASDTTSRPDTRP